MSIELPPLPKKDYAGEYSHTSEVYNVTDVDAAVKAREHILIDRVAELERLWRSAEACYAEADADAMSHAQRIAELEAELLAAADVLDNCRYSEQPAAKRARDAARGAST